MIKVNLLPVKKKKKARRIPAFLISMIAITLLVAVVLAYVVYYFNTLIKDRQAQIRQNDRLIAELTVKIKEVEDYEKRNRIFEERKKIIEQLGKNKSVPVKIIDEISALLPSGIWMTGVDLKGSTVNLDCIAFSNTDVVNYVNSLKKSKLAMDVFLKESVQTKIETYTLYKFKLSFKVKT